MGKKKNLSAEKSAVKKQLWNSLVPQEASKHQKEFVMITNYMLNHESFIGLSANSKVAYLYLRSWASSNNSFWNNNGRFEFASSLLNKYMSHETARKCLEELVKKGFLNQEYKKGSNYPNRYSFASRWYDGEFVNPVIDNYKSVIEQPN